MFDSMTAEVEVQEPSVPGHDSEAAAGGWDRHVRRCQHGQGRKQCRVFCFWHLSGRWISGLTGGKQVSHKSVRPQGPGVGVRVRRGGVHSSVFFYQECECFPTSLPFASEGAKMKHLTAWGVFIFLLAFSVAGLAQTFRGTILGTVTDQTGAVVPGAKVTVRNVDTGLTRETQTTGDGSYTVPELPIGNYSVTVEKSDFQTSVVTGVRVEVAGGTGGGGPVATGEGKPRGGGILGGGAPDGKNPPPPRRPPPGRGGRQHSPHRARRHKH